MNLKKTAFSAALVFMLVGAAPMALPSMSNTAYAARGGARMSRPAAPVQKALPSTTQKSPAANSQTTKTTPKDTTTQAKTNTQQNTANQSRSTGFGSAMRNIGLFAGGMFLGSMLSNLFGWGNMGFMSDILGVLFNVVILFAVIALIRYAWRRIRGTSRKDDEYRRGYDAAMRNQKQPQDQVIHRQEDAFTPIDVSKLYRSDDKRRESKSEK